MAYARRYVGGFVDLPTQTTAIDSTFLNAVEASLLKLQAVDASTDAQVLQWDNANSRYAPALILNKNVDPAAAIAKSKLDFTGGNGIVNADIAGAAAISLSKLASVGTIGSGVVSVGAAGKTAISIADTGAQASGITIGGDTNLYRNASGVLRMDGAAGMGAFLDLSNNTAAYLRFGTAQDTNLYRVNAGVLATDSNFIIGRADATHNVYINSNADASGGGGGTGVLVLGNAGSVPTANPPSAGVIYVQAGALKYRGSAGTVTTIAPA